MATNPSDHDVSDHDVQEFVNKKEAELAQQYFPIDGEDAQRAWLHVVVKLPPDGFRWAVLDELVARGYIDAGSAENLRLSCGLGLRMA